ncbi:MAG: hypothetical protein J2P13_00365, partial [Acidobacteria bacterium]|nr:hypothetical protein [Acidobacteriota bacterium]
PECRTRKEPAALLISNSLKNVRFLAVLALLAAAAGCGGGTPVLPHPTGNFSNASFKGSYVFEMRGAVLADSAGDLVPYREVGVITADGNGKITGGTDAAAAFGSVLPNSTSISGSYAIGQDGTGQITLNSSALGAVFSSPINLAVTLSSSSSAQLLEADFFADGSGTAELQDSTAIGAAPSGTFVFRIHQDSTAQNNASASQVGVLALSTGNVTGGSMDQNLLPGGSSSPAITGGNLATPTSMGAGTGSFTDNSPNTTDFFYYIVNRGKFVLLVSDPGAVGSGRAEAQSGPVAGGLSGTYAFGSRGDGINGGTAAVATVGQFTAGGGSFSGALDAMVDGIPSGTLTFTGTPQATSPQGRTQVAVTGGGAPTMIFWMVSPSRAFFLNENENFQNPTESASEDGTADLQTASSFSAGTIKGQYALAMDGVDLSTLQIGEPVQAVGRIATLQFDGSGKITLVELVNDSLSGSGAQSPGTLGGSYQVGKSGRITTQITNNNQAGPDLVLYAVSPSQAYALQTDPQENTSGTIALQQ